MSKGAKTIRCLHDFLTIDARRLKAYGVGPLVPASTNRSEEGRAANRRVELVEQ